MAENVSLNFDPMDLDEMIKIVKDMNDDHAYKLKRARTPRAKRLATTNLRFWGTAGYYLDLIRELTDDEFLKLEEKVKQRKKEVVNG